MNTKTRRLDAAQLTIPLTTPVLTAAQQAERPDRETRLAAAHAVLARGLAGVRDDPQALAAYLAFAARFHDYSPRNVLLVYLQRPTARFCAGFKTWMKHGRRVRAGERGLMIYAPIIRSAKKAEIQAGADADERVVGYRTATVFDLEQTVAFRDDALEYTPPVPRLEAEGPAGLLVRLEAAAEQIGCSVHYTALGYADGWFREADRTIAVRASLSDADRCSVLTHELAHAVAHSKGAPTGEAVLSAQDRASKELQAEGAAYVALAALGLDTERASLPYLKSWAGGDDRLLAELSAIDRIARRLLALVDAV